MIRNIVCEGTIKEIIGEPKKVKNLLSVMEKYKNK